MAHEIMDHDTFVSYNDQQAWHGLGQVIAGYPTLEEAWKNSGMDWMIEQFPVQAAIPLSDGIVDILELDEKFVNVRMDKRIPLGVVGNDYEVIQNEEHWKGFVVPYAEHTGSQIETTGTLRNGRVIWFLLKKGEVEYVKNDPITEYFLLASSHDGSLCTTIMNTPVRVVCNNTLTAAINGSKNAFKVRHHANHSVKIEEIKRAIGFGDKFMMKFDEVFAGLANLQMTATKQREILDEVIFPKKMAEIDPALILTLPKEREKVSLKGETIRQGKIDKVMELTEIGMGSDIPGVRGTGYGLYNAITEYYDHYGRSKKERDGRSVEEQRFESNFFGQSQRAKEQALNAMLPLIQ